jgi:hypothetical protein
MKVYSAINAVQADLSKEGITKDRRNQQQGYNFRGIDDVYNALSGLLSRHGLCIIPRYLSRAVTERETQKGGTLFYVVVEAEYDVVAAEDGSKHTARTYGEAMDSADKATNKAMSAAYKYLCMQLFSIPTEGDNDADAHTPVVKGSKEAAQAVGAKKIEELKAKVKAGQPAELQGLLAMDPEDAFAVLKEMLVNLADEDFAQQCYRDATAGGLNRKKDPEMLIKRLYASYVANQPPKEETAA